MCGVCGIVSFGEPLPPRGTEPAIRAMLDALAHRGPDDVGLEAASHACLGATRLAIRGLHDGAQPIADEAGLLVACNGEIDNHLELRAWLQSRGRRVPQATDVAVLPGLYLELGVAFVERLVGAFAIAIWDQRSKQLVLARDRVGERPLFYRLTSTGATFATEISALVAASPGLRPDRDALAAYVRTGAFEAPATPFEGVTKVAPGHVVTLSRDGANTHRYWRWSPGSRPAERSADGGSHDAFDVVLREAVRRQSDVEVPLGLMVSGGLDSSLLAAVLRSLEPRRALPAYVIRFHEGSFDEGEPAEKVAKALRLDLVSAWVTPEDVPQELKRLVGTVGEPLGDPAWVPMAILARRAAEDIKVALVGEGADELFGGYPTYLGARLAGTYNAFPRLLQRAIAAGVAAWPVSEKKVGVSSLLKRFVAAAELPPGERHLQWLASVPDALLARLGLAAPPRRLDVPAGLLDALQQHDLETSLAEGLLTKSDRASMQAALELRAPFLDVGVMAFAEGLPESERVSGLTTKVFLKRHAERYLPREIVHRRKRGLSVPLATWLRGPLRAWADERLRSPALATLGIRPEAARALLAEHASRRFDHGRAIWTLVVLSEWLDWAAATATRPQAGAASDAARAG